MDHPQGTGDVAGPSAEPRPVRPGVVRAARILAVLAAAATIVVAGAVTADATTTDRHHTGTLSWRPCPDTPTIDCATLRVPIDWSHPDGGTFDLALARHKATDPTRRVGPLIVNPGGPGGSGVDFVKETDDPNGFGAAMFSTDLRARFDLIGWDPRGVGASSPIRCDPGLLAAAPSPHPTSATEFAALAAYNRTLARDCRSHTGPVFDHIDTASTARDVEAIRLALGEGRLNFYAMSYGTQIGEQYTELFPGHVRAMALDGVADHSTGAFGNATMLAQALEQSYGQFADWCLRTPACALYPTDPRTVLDQLYTAALNGTITIPGRPDQVITPDVLLNYLRGGLMGSARWFGFAQELGTVLAEPGRTAVATDAAPARNNPAAATSATPIASQEVAETFITCADHRWGISTFDQLQRLEAAMNRVAPHTHFSVTALKEVTQCLGWPYPVANPQHRLDVDGDPNILMVSSRYDVATPYPGAVNALRQIGPSANLLVYDGTSHADYPETPCVQVAVDTYLFTGHAPAPGTHCPAVFPDPHQAAAPTPTKSAPA